MDWGMSARYHQEGKTVSQTDILSSSSKTRKLLLK